MSENFYTDVTQSGGMVLVRGYRNGKAFSNKIRYHPTHYVRSKEISKLRSMSGQYLKPVVPGSVFETKKFIEQYDGVEGFDIYGTDRYDHQYIQDNFDVGENWDRSTINVTTLDIECQADQGFPDIKSSPMPITAITIKNNIDNIYRTWGLDAYDKTKTKLEGIVIEYICCKNEVDLLQQFMLHWVKNYPDVITGWNSRLFDIPYLHSRINKVLGSNDTAENAIRFGRLLSPWKRERVYDQLIGGSYFKVVEMCGIQQLDYLPLFRKFGYIYGTQSSYALNNIANVVLGEKKLDYGEYGTLNQLYKENHQKFIDYNIKDVQLVDKMEDKLGLITLAMTIAYRGGVNYTDALRNVPVWDAIINKELRKRSVIEDGRKYRRKDGQIEGAYVKAPKVGMHRWVTSFDLNSLYPHLMVQYNMSPETIVDKEVSGVNVDDLLDQKEYDIPDGFCMSGRGNLFKTEERGLLPLLVEKYYADRVKAKQEMLKAEQQLEGFKGDRFEKYKLEKKVATLGNVQMAIKILMNSLYGAMSNEYFRYFDPRIAESITLSGQLTIRWAEKAINENLNLYLKTDNVDYVIAIDTDSLYVDLGPLVKRAGFDNFDREKIVEKIDKEVVPDLEKILKKRYKALQKYMHTPTNKMVMAREVIADKGVWTAKKHYMLNVLNNEGVQYKEPHLKIMGIESVRSSTPLACREMIRETIRVIMDTDEQHVQKTIEQKRVDFLKRPIEEISFPRGIGDGLLDKYKSSNMLYKKGTPIQVRGALLYNHYLKEKGLENKYGLIHPGDKLKFVYLKLPNFIEEDVIAYHTVLPPEFKLHDFIDYDKQFDKGYLEPINNILNAIGWEAERRGTLDLFFQ